MRLFSFKRGFAQRKLFRRRKRINKLFYSEGSSTLKVGLVQIRCREDPLETQKIALDKVEEAFKSGAKFVLLPELYRTMLPRDLMEKYAEKIPGETTQQWASLAKKYQGMLLAGSMLEPAGDGKLYNTSVLFSGDGKIVSKYRKIHLFDVDVPGVITFLESAVIKPGKEVVNYESPYGKIGLAVCYDLRFPELFRIHSKNNCKIICVPSAFSFGTGKKHWHTLLKARAIENQVFILAPNQCGTAPNKFQCYGHSIVYDPWGEVLAESPDSFNENIIYAVLDYNNLEKVRRELPSLKHSRL